MPGAGAERRLASIVALDVAGYSARTEADEDGTVADVARHAIAAKAVFASPQGDEALGRDANPTRNLFVVPYPEFRSDPRFVQLCARLGLVEYWMTTQHWPDCADEVSPYYDFKAECARVAAGPPLPPAV